MTNDEQVTKHVFTITIFKLLQTSIVINAPLHFCRLNANCERAQAIFMCV